MKKKDCYELGRFGKTHGLKGEIRIIIDTDEPDAYLDVETIFVEIKDQLVPYFVENAFFHNDVLIVKLDELDTIEQVEPLKGKKIFLPLEGLPQLQSDQFYFHEIIDFEIHDQELGYLGKVKAVYDEGPQTLFSFMHKGREVLVPLADGVVLEVDKLNKKVLTLLPEGLMEL
jgi:16S rRNA processing protein RimM